MTPDEYIHDRLDDQIAWYDQKSKWNQKCFRRLRIIEIVFATTIPFLVSQVTEELSILKWIVGVMGVSVAVISALTTLYKFHENWIEYRTTAENLKHEKYLYLAKAMPYDGDDSFEQLVSRVESLISKENTTWASTIRAKVKEKNGG